MSMSSVTLLNLHKDPLARVVHHSIKDEVAERFATLIASGVLNVGDAMPGERDLASTMGVSRETIRGALLILSSKGIVSVVQGARTKVVSADIGQLGMSAMSNGRVTDYALEDVHEGRLMVEAQIAVLAVERIDVPTINQLKKLVEVQETTIVHPVSFLIADRAFHNILYQSCGNAVLSDLAANLYSYQLNHRRSAISKTGAIEQSIADHSLILRALVARDADALIKAFGVHERRIYSSTLALLGIPDNEKNA
jgi:DNA-binding FadR family transcriptional regulator